MREKRIETANNSCDVKEELKKEGKPEWQQI